MRDCSHGPVSSMPGSVHPADAGDVCINHRDRPAVAKIQGETDSMGCEYLPVCAECKVVLVGEARAPSPGVCGWCGRMAEDRRPTRDYDEGMAGPIYHVCGECRSKADEAAAEELEASGYYERMGYDYD